MKIAGLQKVTLIDYPGKVAATVFLWGCNFRCGFCHNSELVIKPFTGGFSEEEVLEFLRKRIGKLDAVCFTGGEPLLSLEFDFVSKIKEMGYLIKIDTNGSFPERLKELIERKLVDYIAMDIKSSRENYSKVAGVNVDLDKIEKSIKIISEFPEYEFRTTVVRRYHDEEEMLRLAKWLNEVCGKKPKRFSLQAFKRHENLIDPSFSLERDVSENDLKEVKKVIDSFFEEVFVKA